MTLPILREGWKYEGWVHRLSDGEDFSTGRFLSPSGADEDRAGVTADTFGIDIDLNGHADGPRFPGQDFILPTASVPAPFDLDSGDFGVFVSIEPNPDNDPGPFPVRFLENAAIDSVGRLVAVPLARPADARPSATVVISRGPQTLSMANRAAGLPSGTVTVGSQ
jgi:hypothetical protein